MVIRTAVGRSTEDLDFVEGNFTQIKVVGVGGGGTNAVNRMIHGGVHSVDFVVINTDAQSLVRSLAPIRLRIGDKLTRGLGVGGDHKMGMLAAEESRDQIVEAVEGADMLFITAGMGGGTGTGAAAVVAETAKELGMLTVAVVTRPFTFEGSHRAGVAADGIVRLRERADTIIVIPNERLLSTCDLNISIEAAFKMVDDVLLRSIQGISEVITLPGHINLDFNDVRTIMKDAGYSWIAVGHGNGDTRAVDAAQAALVSPLFDFSIEKAKRILFNIVGNDLSLAEVNQAADVIRQYAHPNSQIIFGLGTDPSLESEVKLTLIATDFSDNPHSVAPDEEETPDYSSEPGRRKPFLTWK